MVWVGISVGNLTVASSSGSEVLLRHNDLVISLADVNHYFSKYGQGGSREKLYQEPNLEIALRSIYIANQLASQNREEVINEAELVGWIGRQNFIRIRADMYLSDKIEELMETVDWDALTEEYYISHPDEFKRGEQVRASHILIAEDEKSVFERVQLAEQIRQRALGGADFNMLLTEYSAAQDSSSGGDLGFFGRGRMVPAFEEAAFSLADGEVSDLVITDFGIHVIRVTGRRPAEVVPLEEARSVIRRQLEPELRADFRSKLIEEVASGLQADTVVRNEAIIKALLEGEYE